MRQTVPGSEDCFESLFNGISIIPTYEEDAEETPTQDTPAQ